MVLKDRFDIVIGLNDRKSISEELGVDEVIRLIEKGFSDRELAFSITSGIGGYLYSNGIYSDERNIVIRLIGSPIEVVSELVTFLKKELNQESILVKSSKVEVMYI